MNQVSLVTLMCLVMGVSAARLEQNRPDFEGLNKFLVRRFDYNDPESNVVIIRQHLAKLEGPIREAADVVIKLVDANGCDDEVLSHLVKIREAGVTWSGHRRIDATLRTHLARMAAACTAYLDCAVESRVDGKFSEQVIVGTGFDAMSYLRPLYEGHNHSDLFPLRPIYRLVWKLANADPNPGLDEQNGKMDAQGWHHAERAYAARAFDKYLVQPCRKYILSNKDLFEGVAATGNVVDIGLYFYNRTKNFRTKAFTYAFCRIVEANSDKLKCSAVIL